MGYFFLISWTPTLLTAAQLPPTTAALAGALLQVGGTIGALVLCRWLEQHRFFAIAIMFVLAVPPVGFIGFAGIASQLAPLVPTFLVRFFARRLPPAPQFAPAPPHPPALRA